MSFLGEIKRRKVFQVAAVYAVVAWLTIQIVDVVGEPLSLPGWLDTVVIILLAVGFPIAVVLAWAFDLTPQGIKADSEIQNGSAPIQQTGQRLNFIIQGLVLVAVGFLVVDQYLFAPGAGIVAPRPVTSSTPLVSRVRINIPSSAGLNAGNEPSVAISPDGTKIVFVLEPVEGSTPLYLRTLDEFEPVQLPGTESGRLPFFSPDGRWVGFWANGMLKKAAVDGGTPIEIATAPLPYRGASWGPDDVIVLGGNNPGMQQVSADGGALTAITSLKTDEREDYHAWPQFLPSGREVLFTVHRTGAGAEWNISLLELGQESWTPVPGTQGGTQPHYVETGHIVYGRAGSLSALRFDTASRMPSGTSVPVLNGAHTRFHAGMALTEFTVSRNGTLIYVAGDSSQDEIVAIDRFGEVSPLAGPRAAHPYGIDLSPLDGRWLAFTYNPELVSSDIWIQDLERNTRSRLTTSGSNIRPLWSPDGSRIVFSSFRNGSFGLYSMPADLSAEAVPLLIREYGQFAYSWSPDGNTLFYMERNPTTGDDIWTLSLDDPDPVPLLASQFDEGWPALSPDGAWLAYVSDQSGRNEIYIQPYPGPGRRRLVSNAGGEFPVWATDGDELHYLSDDNLMTVPIQTEPTFSLGTPVVLFELPQLASRDFTMAPDGERFFMMVNNQVPLSELNVVLDWSEELTQLAPSAEQAE